MNLLHALKGVEKLYIETAPLIYYIEENETYLDKMVAVIGAIEDRPISAISSVITLTEVLIHPIRNGNKKLETAYREILNASEHFELIPVSSVIAESAARLRASYNSRTPDALHIATAIAAEWDAFLSNDSIFKRVTDLQILLLDELES